MSVPVTRFELPPLYCPLPPSSPHPEEELLEKRGLDWLERSGIFPTPGHRAAIADTRSHVLLARRTPRAPADLVQLGVDWAYLMFSVDDRRTEHGTVGNDTTRSLLWFHGLEYATTLLDTTGLPDDLFYGAAAQLSARIRNATSPSLWRRWLADNQATYWAEQWAVAHLATGAPADFNAFLRVRAAQGLAPSVLTCSEIAAGLDVPERERDAPPVRALTEASGLLVTLDDDLYSFPKEAWNSSRAGRDPAAEPTPIPTLMRRHRCTLDEAVQMLARLRDRIMARALHLADRITTGPYSSDTRALADLALIAVGNGLDWARHAPRYTNPDGESPGAIHIVWAGRTTTPPPDTSAPPYPAIAWWWDV